MCILERKKTPQGQVGYFLIFFYSMNFEKSKSVLVDKVNLLLENVDPKGTGAVAHHFRPIAVLTEGQGLICSPLYNDSLCSSSSRASDNLFSIGTNHANGAQTYMQDKHSHT